MGPMISAQAKAIGLPRKTLYRLLYRYWLFGCTKNALLPNYILSRLEGPRGESRVTT